MSDSEDRPPGSEEPQRSSLWRKLKSRLRGSRDRGLRESLEGAIKIHAEQNPGENFAPEAKSMMLNIIEFSNLRVDDVMVPRADIVAVDETTELRALMQRFTEAGHSRLPIYRETLDGITGMVHVKDFIGWMAAKGFKKKRTKTGKPPGGLSIPAADMGVDIRHSGLHREVLFVPPSMPAPDLLVKMQTSRCHLAIVIDEYGGTDGLVSIEDLVEVIVGDISDEHDTEEDSVIKPVGDGAYIALGRADLAEVEKLFGVDLLSDEDDAETDTLAGFISKIAGRVPSRGELIRHASGLGFEILESDPRRLKRVRIRALPKTAPEGSDQAGDTSG
jgi:CBS domain containing-hemolysin-like protein